MKEQGEVISVNGKFAVVKINKKDECSKCGMCLFPKNANSVNFDAENTLSAKVGDKVTIEREKDAKLLGAILVFLIPLLLIVISTLINHFFIKKEIWILILSVLFIVLWYTILAVIDKKLKFISGFCCKIVSIDEKGENK